ncbi:hypothetical protein O7627_27740 [Solwaraspora sp. WMMD1047]|uniref:hypothetical protein n=1 Tax=Solwaraspora sp. WMMD1047 TaxID=3016102 RepID=UPI0024168259|nr:hypothetical protein [Solwaraspora sp. WMMD1047]MDG4833069.1 hypothetical protein [Solwaraspora sp. WMMD1047]
MTKPPGTTTVSTPGQAGNDRPAGDVEPADRTGPADQAGESPDRNPTDSGSPVDEPADGGSADNGSPEDGSVEDGSVEDGSVEDGSVEDGSVDGDGAGGAAATGADRPGDGERSRDRSRFAPGAIWLALLSVAWLAAMLWAAQRSISFSGAHSIAITTTAYALPGVISAGLVGGAAVSLLVANLLSRRGVPGASARFAAAVGAGLLTGVLAALAVGPGSGAGSAEMLLAATTAAAATVGGIAGGVRAIQVVGALVAAALAVFAVSFAVELFRDPLLDLYGAGESAASQSNALRWSARTASLCGGLAAGGVAFAYLRRAGRRTSGAGSRPRWSHYLLAGAGPGLLLLVAEVIIWTGGARVLDLAGGLSEADAVAQSMLGVSRVDHALLVLFVGALTAIIILGRTLPPASARPAADIDAAGAEPQAAGAQPPAAPGQQISPSSDTSYHSRS